MQHELLFSNFVDVSAYVCLYMQTLKTSPCNRVSYRWSSWAVVSIPPSHLPRGVPCLPSALCTSASLSHRIVAVCPVVPQHNLSVNNKLQRGSRSRHQAARLFMLIRSFWRADSLNSLPSKAAYLQRGRGREGDGERDLFIHLIWHDPMTLFD